MISGVTFGSIGLGISAIGLILIAFFILKILHRKKFHLPATLFYSKADWAHSILKGTPVSNPQTPPGELLLRSIRILALILLASALARPQKVITEALEPVAGVDIMMVLDTSASMQALDFQPLNRLQAAKEIGADFISKRKADRIGLIVFGGAALLSCPLTLDHQAVLSFLNQVEIGATQTEGTAIGSALMTAISHLRRVPSKSKILILLTDGRNNAGSTDPLTAAKIAKSLDIKIYAVGAGKRGGGIFAVQDPIFGTRYVRAPEEEIDEDMLTKISLATGGRYFRGTEMSELRDIFREIDQLEKTEVEAPRQVRYEDLYPGFVLTALFLLGAEMLMRATWLFTLP